jgi:hypothetical protein
MSYGNLKFLLMFFCKSRALQVSIGPIFLHELNWAKRLTVPDMGRAEWVYSQQSQNANSLAHIDLQPM